MKDKIAEILKEFYPAVYFMMDERTEERFGEYIDRVEEYNKAILDLIAKELPKEKMGISIKHGEQWEGGYNQAIKDIKHKLTEG